LLRAYTQFFAFKGEKDALLFFLLGDFC